MVVITRRSVGYCKICTFIGMKKLFAIVILSGALITGIVCKPSGKSQSRTFLADHPVAPNALKNMFGVNCYEWNILQNPNNLNDVSKPYEPKMALISGFSSIRHYLDWSKIETTQGSYTFNPANNGGWNYDAIYERCKKDNITVLTCLKTCPQWLVNTYPKEQQDNENIPAPYGLNREDPASYISQAKAAFQFAARYGYNKAVNPKLVTVNTKPRWTNDPVNEAKIGMGLIRYIECDNERDKWWKGKHAQQTAREYAANMSAFYDGNKGRLGKNVGVKTADPGMQVVMGGLASADVKYVADMIAWCKKNRGLKPDGSIDLCFDVINYHYYPNDSKEHSDKQATRGIAPELSDAGKVADHFVKLSLSTPKHPEVWVTEAGYDIHPQSPQRAMAIGNKSALITQADWLLRTALLFNRHGIKRLFYYQLFDDNNSSTQYGTSGLADGATLKRRPSADYLAQAGKLMGNYSYKRTISTSPLVDEYTLGGKKMYVLMVPDEKGASISYQLNLGNAKLAVIYVPKPGANTMSNSTMEIKQGKATLKVTETPIFVEGI
jgi:hypothetical protein